MREFTYQLFRFRLSAHFLGHRSSRPMIVDCSCVGLSTSHLCQLAQRARGQSLVRVLSDHAAVEFPQHVLHGGFNSTRSGESRCRIRALIRWLLQTFPSASRLQTTSSRVLIGPVLSAHLQRQNLIHPGRCCQAHHTFKRDSSYQTSS